MADIASLGIAIDTSQVRRAADDLTKFATTGPKAEAAAKTLESAGKKASAGFSTTSKEIQKARSSIDDYIRSQNLQIAVQGKSAAASKLIEISTRGATAAQLQAVASNQKLIDGYQRGLDLGDRLKTTLLGVGVAAAAAATYATVKFNGAVDALARFKDVADTTGASVENISALDRVARQTGSTFETVSDTLVKFNQVLSSIDGKNDASQVLKSLGLDAKELKEIDPAEALRQVAVALNGYADDGNKARAVQELFGKSVKEAGPFLKDLGEQTRLVAVQSTAAAEEADRYTKSMALLRANADDTARSLANNLLPALNNVLELITDLQKQGNFGLLIKDSFKSMAGLNTLSRDADQSGSDINNILAKRIALTGELNDLEGKQGRGAAARRADLQSEIDEQNRYLQIAQSRQRIQVLANQPGDTSDAVSRRGVGALPSINVPARATGGRTPRGTVDRSAEQEAKAELAFTIDKYRKEASAKLDIFSNSQRIEEAMRSANLISETDYYASRRRMIEETGQVQAAAITQEIALLEKQAFTGKEQIENERKIFDAKSKLVALNAKEAADLEILTIQQKAAGTARVNAYKDAEAAANSYYRTIAQQNARDLGGIGKGSLQREKDARRNQREDQAQSRREALEQDLRRNQITKEQYGVELALTEAAHRDVLASDEAFYADRLKKQGNWINGANEALTNYVDDTKNIMKGVEGIFSDAFGGLEDQLTNLFTGKKFDLKGLGDSIASNITRQLVRTNITGPLAESLGDGIKSGDGIGGVVGGLFSTLFGGGGDLGGLSASSKSPSQSLSSLSQAAVEAARALKSLTRSAGGGSDPFSSTVSDLFSFGSSATKGNNPSAYVSGGASDDFFTSLIGGIFGFRESGGPVSAGGRYRVNEKGPELLQVAGKQYLMMGNQPGTVIPNGGGRASERPVNVVNNFHVADGTNTRTQSQIASNAGRGIRTALARNS